LIDLQKQVKNKTLLIDSFIKNNRLPKKYKDAVLKIGLILSVGSKKKECYFWTGGNPTKSDAKYIKYYIDTT
jgi:hypothetical protein